MSSKTGSGTSLFRNISISLACSLTRLGFNRLVGNKITIADIAFIKYNEYATRHLLGNSFDFAAEFPYAAHWHNRMMARPCVREVFTYKSTQDCGRERQHVTGETVSAFAKRMGCGLEVGGVAQVVVN